MEAGGVDLMLNCRLLPGSPWDEDKAMMGRWGLEGMRSFEQVGVARKEGARLEAHSQSQAAPTSGSETSASVDAQPSA